MPKPRKGESEDDFVSRCIPIVINEGTTDDSSQAAAICHSLYKKKSTQQGAFLMEANEMPMRNFHACRLMDPDDFQKGKDKWTYGSRKTDGKTYNIVFGIPKGKTGKREQAYRYPIGTWSKGQAKTHCQKHDGILFEPAKPLKQGVFLMTEMSFDDIRELVRAKMDDKLGKYSYYITETYSDHVIVSEYDVGKYWKFPYTIKDGEVELGDKVQVKRTYVEVTQMAQAQIDLLMAQRHPDHPPWSEIDKGSLPDEAFLLSETRHLPYRYLLDGELIDHPEGVLSMWQAVEGIYTGKPMMIYSSLQAMARAIFQRYWGWHTIPT